MLEENKNPIIFVVSGKANSGKDTTCSLIKNQVFVKNKKCINLQFSSYIKMYAKEISGWNGEEESKPRTLLQNLGTEVIRKKIDENFFIKRIIDDIKVYSYYFDVITISDARFPIELDSIKNAFDNVYKIRVERPGFSNNLTGKERKHETEIALDNYNDYDITITNDKTIDDLNKTIKDILMEMRI